MILWSIVGWMIMGAIGLVVAAEVVYRLWRLAMWAMWGVIGAVWAVVEFWGGVIGVLLCVLWVPVYLCGPAVGWLVRRGQRMWPGRMAT